MVVGELGDEREAVVEGEPEVFEEPSTGWGADGVSEVGSVFIETGRGATAEVQVGTPFQEAVERVADEAHYGGFFRVFLNGEELLNPEEAPSVIEVGMRIAITSCNRGCVPANSGKAEMLILSQAGV